MIESADKTVNALLYIALRLVWFQWIATCINACYGLISGTTLKHLIKADINWVGGESC